jgi:hypothetical protein
MPLVTFFPRFAATCLLGSLILTVPPANAASLAPEMELDRMIFAAEKKLAAGDSRHAAKYLQRAQKLPINPPDEFYLLLGEVQLKNRDWDTARETLQLYVERTGRHSQGYQRALELLTELEETASGEPAVPDAEKARKSISLAPSRYRQKVVELKNLYLTNEADALLEHINTLLRDYAYQDSPIQKVSRDEPGLIYRLASNSEGDLVMTRRESSRKGRLYRTERLSIYGINPFVDSGCDARRCWLQHPVSGKTWMLLQKNRQMTQDLATSLTALIRVMQK